MEVADSNVDLYNHDLLKWLPDNYEWIEEADEQGLLEGCKGDLMKMTQMAQDKLADERGAGTLAREDPTIV